MAGDAKRVSDGPGMVLYAAGGALAAEVASSLEGKPLGPVRDRGAVGRGGGKVYYHLNFWWWVILNLVRSRHALANRNPPLDRLGYR